VKRALPDAVSLRAAALATLSLGGAVLVMVMWPIIALAGVFIVVVGFAWWGLFDSFRRSIREDRDGH
jgi:hypothetical protein